jgi:predicted PurR-regulated permease PerM
VSQPPPPPVVASRSVSARTAARLVLVALLTTLAVVLALWLVYQLQTVIVWGILALFLAVALNPSVNWLGRRHVPRTLAILLMYLVVVIVIAALGILVAPSLLRQGTQLIHVLQKPGGLEAELEKVAGPLGLGGFVKSLGPQLNAIPGQLARSFGSLEVAKNTLSTITALLTVVVLAFFFIHDGARLIEDSVGLFPVSRRPRARRVLHGSGSAISSYIRGDLVISVIAGTSALVGMLVLGVPYPLPLAVLLAVLDLIPMVGVTVGAIPVILAALTVSPIKGVIMLVYIIVYSQIESNVLNPRIYGRRDQLPALVVFVAFLVGSLLWGILGALIAIPAVNIIRVLIRESSDGGAQEAGTPVRSAGGKEDDGPGAPGESDADASALQPP